MLDKAIYNAKNYLSIREISYFGKKAKKLSTINSIPKKILLDSSAYVISK